MSDLETRFCDRCVRFLPITEFRRRYRQGSARMATCRQCHNQAEQERRAERRAKQGRRQLRRRFAGLVDERNRKRVELLTVAMLQDFGGLEGFAAAWQDYLVDARQRGGLAMFRALQVMLRLIEHANDQRPRPSEMSDAELEAALSRFARDHPEIASDPPLVQSGL